MAADNSELWVIRHLPNLLSASRIPAALLLLAIYRPDSEVRAEISVGLVALIMITDLLDGRIARWRGVESEFGYLLDGLGDRAVHVVAYLVLVTAGVVPIVVAWALIFREICQYGVRIVEPAWHGSQSKADRVITRVYMIAVHGALVAEFVRVIVAPGAPAQSYVLTVNCLLCAAAAATYARILPRLARAWRAALDG